MTAEQMRALAWGIQWIEQYQLALRVHPKRKAAARLFASRTVARRYRHPDLAEEE